MKKKKILNMTPLMLTRRIIQAAAFILFPGLFISTFSALKAIVTAIIGGTFTLAANAGNVILVAAMLLITAIMGRFFCGFLCAFGSMGDFFWFVGNKLKLRRPTIAAKTDRVLKSVKYALLAAIVLFGWILGASLLNGTSNPWTVFGMYATWKGWQDLTGLLSVGALLLLAIAAGSMYIERFFCRYLCPLGGIFSLVSKFRLYKIRKPSLKCGSCKACTRHCSMGIPLYSMETVTDSECIDCMQCVDICPQDNVKTNPKPAFAAAVAVVAMSGMYFAGNVAASAASEQTLISAAQLSSQDSAAGAYIDGTYTGSGSGYHGTTQVQVTVSSGYITDITVLSTGDDTEFFTRAKNTVISEIISSQSVAVDTVSGATFSSNGIIAAVTDALSSALSTTGTTVSATESATATESANTSATGEQSTANSSESESVYVSSTTAGSIDLADGTYTGTGTGYRGETKVSVTVKSGTITSITVTSYRDDEQFFSRAESMIIQEILAGQTPDVDVVSGATYSSNGIMEAVADALNIDFTATTPVNNGHGGHGGH